MSKKVAPLCPNLDSKSGDQIDRKQQDRYGWGLWTPDCFQCLHTPKFLLFCLSAGIFAQRIGFALFPSIVTTISQQFGLSTTQIGFIQSFNDVIAVAFTVIVSHYGEKGHKGRWLGISCILALLAVLTYTIPQWISDPPELESLNSLNFSSQKRTQNPLCLLEDHPEHCSKGDTKSSWLSAPFWIFTAAAILAAAAGTPFHILALPYLDENVLQASSPVYLAVVFGAGLIAAAFGFGISGVVLRIYGNAYRLKPGQIKPQASDPTFVGAWWLGYVFSMPLIVLTILPLFGFARDLPNKSKYRARDIEQTHGGDNKTFGGRWSDYPAALKKLAVNPVFMLHLVRSAIQLFFVSGIVTFLPLYFEQILQFPRSIAGMLTGLFLLVPVCLGGFVSSVIMKKKEMTSKTLLIICFVFSVIGLFPGLGFLSACPTPKFVGINTNYQNEVIPNQHRFNDTCNLDCHCKLSDYRPVCFKEKDLAFFNPCFAGCRKRQRTEEGFVYRDCGCVAQHFSNKDATLTTGLCPLTKKCNNRKYIVIVLITFGFLVGGMEVPPMTQLSLRTVPFSQRTMAGGIRSIIIKLFGFAPGPVIFGYFLDKACIQRIVKCGRAGACAKYNNETVSLAITAVTVVSHVVALLCNLLSLVLYKPPKEEAIATKIARKIRKR